MVLRRFIKMSSSSLDVGATRKEVCPLDALAGGQENGSISQRHDLRPEPSLSFSFASPRALRSWKEATKWFRSLFQSELGHRA